MNKKQKSRMWLYFEVVSSGNGVKQARCKQDKCNSGPISLPDNTTINLWRHINSNHPEVAAIEQDIKQRKAKEEEVAKKKNSESISNLSTNQTLSYSFQKCLNLISQVIRRSIQNRKGFIET